MKVDERASRARRAAALARPELRTAAPYVRVEERLPEVGRHCAVWVSDGRAPYRLPFPVALMADGGWNNVRHDRKLEVGVVGWIYSPS